MEPTNPVPVIVGEAVAGEAAKIKKQITEIIKGVSKSTFTLAELLHEVKVKQHYTKWGHDSFGEYVKTLELKSSKAYYLCRIIENMLIAGVPKEVYEPVGIAKLRVIAKLDPTETFEGKTMASYIKGLAETAVNVELDTLQEAVAHLQGQVNDNARVWLNVNVNKSARENVIMPAIEKMRKSIGTVGENEDGTAKDSSDGRCIELICAEYLSDGENGE